MDLDGVGADGDLFPVGAVRDCQAGDGAGSTSGEVNDAPRELWSCDSGGVGRGDVGEGGDLDLFAGANSLEAAWYFFAHF